jgi:hypothetical protein
MSGFTLINVGAAANDGNGDSLRASQQTVNANYASTLRGVEYTSDLSSETAASGYVRVVYTGERPGVYRAKESNYPPNGVTEFSSASAGWIWELVSVSRELDQIYFTHGQTNPDTTWVINHNLMRFPGVTIINGAKLEVVGNVEYVDQNSLKVKFSSEQTGTAYLI